MEQQQYVDDLSISSSAVLWRRIPPRHFTTDRDTGRIRPSSAAFEDHPNGSPMSVVLGDDVLAAHRTAESILAGHPGFALASLTAGLARENQQGIAREPLPDEPAHAVVFGHKTKKSRGNIAKASVWVIPPPDLSHEDTPAADVTETQTRPPSIAIVGSGRSRFLWLLFILIGASIALIVIRLMFL